MTDKLLAAVAAQMNKLDEIPVVWDRCVFHEKLGEGVAYGWIERKDGRRDFVNLEVRWGKMTDYAGRNVGWLSFGSTTSSAKWSPRITEILYGKDADHTDCQRIEDIFGGLVNCKILQEAPVGG